MSKQLGVHSQISHTGGLTPSQPRGSPARPIQAGSQVHWSSKWQAFAVLAEVKNKNVKKAKQESNSVKILMFLAIKLAFN